MDSIANGSQQTTRVARWLLVALSAIPLAVQLAGLLTPGYGYFIDEFYYFACAARPAFGYVDHPPLAPWILALTRPVLGDSLLGLRLVAFLAGSATVWVTCLLVGRLGGGWFATVLAGITVGLAPLVLAMSGFYSMNAFEPLFWMMIVLTVVRIVQTGESRSWVAVGLLVGLSFENKHTAMVYVVALGLGLLATRTRRILFDRWLWAGAGLALLVALPNIWWQVANGFPSLEFYRNAHFLKNVPSPPLRSLASLALAMNPVALPVWIAGFAFLLDPRMPKRRNASAISGSSAEGATMAGAIEGHALPELRLEALGRRDGKVFRFLGVTCVLLLAAHVASQTSRPDRVTGMFPILLSAGAVFTERLMKSRTGRAALVGAAAATGLALAPMVVPLLSPSALAPYAAALGTNQSAERGKTSPIPQLLADRTGWESYVDDVERVYKSLSPEDRQRAIIYAPSYGQAGAIELLGPARGLPRVIGTQNTYWHWSAGHTNTEVLIAVDASAKRLRSLFRDVRVAGLVECDYCMSWRNHLEILVARGSIAPMESTWARLRHYE